jgi:N12 class adenine-specific DNA methylase
LIDVRDAVRDCLRSQIDGSGEERVIETRETTESAYDRFVGRFGYGQCPGQSARVSRRPGFAVAALAGNYDEETKRAVKAAIFRERTIHHKQPVESVGTPKEALLVSLNEKGRVDLDHMASTAGPSGRRLFARLEGHGFS